MYYQHLHPQVAEKASPVDRLGGEVVAGLDLDAVDLKARAGLGVDALLAFEIGELDRVDPRRIGGQEPGVGPRGGDQAGFLDRFQTIGEGDLIPANWTV